jgi:hypothetical protein
MVRRSALLAVLLAAVFGCSKSSPSTGGAPGDGPQGEPGAAYVIKIRDKKAGERYEMTRAQTESKLQFQGAGKGKEPPAPSVEKVTTKAAYTEEVEAVDGGAVTKGKRAYTVAEGEDFGKVKPLPFVGKTVAFESKGGRFVYTVEGKEVPPGPEAFALDADSDRNKLKGLTALVPETPVRVGEGWEVPADKLAAVLGPEARGAACKVTGKLEKAYTKDGKQFGVVVVKIEGLLKETGPKLTAELTYDGCIDGTATEGTRKSIDTIAAPAVPGGPAFPDMVNTSERTIKPAK